MREWVRGRDERQPMTAGSQGRPLECDHVGEEICVTKRKDSRKDQGGRILQAERDGEQCSKWPWEWCKRTLKLSTTSRIWWPSVMGQTWILTLLKFQSSYVNSLPVNGGNYRRGTSREAVIQQSCRDGTPSNQVQPMHSLGSQTWFLYCYYNWFKDARYFALLILCSEQSTLFENPVTK